MPAFAKQIPVLSQTSSQTKPEMRHILTDQIVFLFLLILGQTRQLIRIFDFLFFFADWARVITIGATQSE